jgi:ATP-dependent Clp protease ATP-binding subunit ClpC
VQGFNFTERTRKVLAMAREDALALGHEYVGTEHLLLGLIREGQGVASTVMHNLSASPDALRERILETIRRGEGRSGQAELPYTSRAKKVIELSMAEARRLHHSYVGTEHLLLGLLAEKQGIAAQVLGEAGVTLEAAGAETMRILGDPAVDDDQAPIAFSAQVPRNRPEPSVILVELRFPDGSTRRRECRDRHEAFRFLMQ